MKKAVVVLCVCISFCLPLRSLAWGQLGHRIVAEIADSYLNAKAKAAIREIFGYESLAMASNWADFIKSDSTYKYLDTWHYVNFEKDLSYDQMKAVLAKDTATDAYTRIRFLEAQLRNKALARDKKVMYLRLLIHIVGDIHQPLHVSPVGTTGGNDVKVTWFTTPSNLHRVWDAQLIEQQQLSYTEYVRDLNHTTPAQRKQWQSQPLTAWLYESYTMAQALIAEISEPNEKLSYRYNFDHVKTLNDQLLKGGVRLAGVLNSIFGS